MENGQIGPENVSTLPFTRQISKSRRPASGRWRAALTVVMLCYFYPNALVAVPAYGQASWHDNLDGAELRLQLRQGTAPTQVLLHQLQKRDSQHGTAAERIVLRCAAGHSAPLALPIPRAPVIQEFRAEFWVKCNRPGVQVAAKVVLPRSINPSTGRPTELILRGSNIGVGNQWEKLTLGNLPAALENTARVARMQLESAIDSREAYVSELVLLVPGGPGNTDLLVDQLKLFGVVDQSVPQQEGPALSGPVGNSKKQTKPGPPLPRPRVPRIIRWQGESFEYLAKLGFQAIGMQRLPTDQELGEADRLGLWIICPPPEPQIITKGGISEEYRQVLSWDLGEQLSQNDLGQTIRWQELIKRYDKNTRRETLLTPQLLTREASRIADVVVLDRAIMGTGLTLRDYATWLSHRTRLARPGTPTWTRISTQISPEHETQAQAFGVESGLGSVTSYSQLNSILSAAIGVQTDGFYFDSRSSLEAKDAASTYRAQALELTNIRLGLMEPWLAAGKMLASARSNDPLLTALVLRAERSHLLVPIWWSHSLDAQNSASLDKPTWFIVPGVAESSEAWLITLGGPQRLRHQRVTGGVRIALDQLPADGLILLTDDPGAFSQVARHLRTNAQRSTKLRQNLINSRLRVAERAYPSLAGGSVTQEELQASLGAAQNAIRGSEEAAQGRNFDQAYKLAAKAEHVLDATESLLWSKAIGSGVAAQHPLILSLETLPRLLQWSAAISSNQAGQNLLPEGGFESLENLLNAGWKHKTLEINGVITAVRLSTLAPRSGQYCLELEASPDDKLGPVPVIPTSPVWVRSKPVRIAAGQVLEISGVARVPEELLGTVDGLQIFDTLGGADLATRIKISPSWQPFLMRRASAANADVQVTIALSGLGVAQVDDLQMRVISSTSANRLTSAPSNPPTTPR